MGISKNKKTKMVTHAPTIASLSLYFLLPAPAQPFVIEWLSGIKYVPPPAPSQDECRDCRITNGDRQGEARFLFGSTPTQLLECCSGTEPQCTCGMERNRRVVGGLEVLRGKYPWIAPLIHNNYQIGACAATLIASTWAVTAAHCAVLNGNITSIVLGEHDIPGIDAEDINTYNRKEVRVEKIIIHPDFTPFLNILGSLWFGPKPIWPNDIALLKLAEEVDLSVHTPACLPESGRDFTGQMGSVYGWGRTDHCNPYSLSPVLKEATLEIVSDATCETYSGTYQFLDPNYGTCTTVYGSYAGLLSENMLCAGADGKSGCQGDSGGPLTVKEGDKHSLVGVVSWGHGCGEENFSTVFAEVAHPDLRKWIDDTIAENGGALYCPNPTGKR